VIKVGWYFGSFGGVDFVKASNIADSDFEMSFSSFEDQVSSFRVHLLEKF
jgi:hypothetical protein